MPVGRSIWSAQISSAPVISTVADPWPRFRFDVAVPSSWHMFIVAVYQNVVSVYRHWTTAAAHVYPCRTVTTVRVCRRCTTWNAVNVYHRSTAWLRYLPAFGVPRNCGTPLAVNAYCCPVNGHCIVISTWRANPLLALLSIWKWQLRLFARLISICSEASSMTIGDRAEI